MSIHSVNATRTDDCMICLGEIVKPSIIFLKKCEYLKDLNELMTRVSKVCNHIFCFDCLTQWMKINSSCPLCRKVGNSRGLIDSEIANISLGFEKEYRQRINETSQREFRQIMINVLKEKNFQVFGEIINNNKDKVEIDFLIDLFQKNWKVDSNDKNLSLIILEKCFDLSFAFDENLTQKEVYLGKILRAITGLAETEIYEERKNILLQFSIEELCGGLEIERAWEVASYSEDVSLKNIILKEKVNHLLENNQFEEALSTVLQIKNEFKAQLPFLERIVQEHLSLKNFDGVLAAVQGIEHKGCQNGFLSQLMEDLFEKNEIETALSLIKSNNGKFWKNNFASWRDFYVINIFSFFLNDQKVTEAEDLISYIKWPSRKDSAWIEISNFLLAQGNFREALKKVENISSPYKKGKWLMNAMTKGSSKIFLEEEKDLSKQKLNQVLELAEIEQSFNLKIDLFLEITQFYLLADKKEEFLEFLNKTFELVKTLDRTMMAQRNKDKIYLRIYSLYLKSNLPEKALEVVKLIDSLVQQIMPLKEIEKAYQEENNQEKVQEIQCLLAENIFFNNRKRSYNDQNNGSRKTLRRI